MLAHCIDEVEVLMLPKGLGERFVSQAAIWRATGGLGGIHSTSNGLEQPVVVLVLQEVKMDGKVMQR